MEKASETAAKARRRKRASAVRDALPEAERFRLSETLSRTTDRGILQPLRNRLGRPLVVCAYSAFRSEADPAPLVRLCWQAGDTVAVPRISDAGGMEWRIVRDPQDWRQGRWGIPEPDPARTAPVPDDQVPDVILVPGLAFDRRGGRLGYGGGYYDRMYAEEARRGRRSCWIGFLFSAQMTEEPLPKENHDLVLDVLATEEDIIWLTREGT